MPLQEQVTIEWRTDWSNLKTENKIQIWKQSSRRVCKKGVLKNFPKFTGKHQRQGVFFNKVAGLRPATLLKKRLWRRCFPANFTEFLRTSFFIEHLRWLLLRIETIKNGWISLLLNINKFDVSLDQRAVSVSISR